MRAAAYFIILVVHTMWIGSVPLSLMKNRPIIHLADHQLRKLPCGPILFPELSCEVTTCGPASRNDDDFLDQRYETTCIPVRTELAQDDPEKEIEGEALRQRRPIKLNFNMNPLRDEGGTTTSTMPPYPTGPTPGWPPGWPRCQNNANCHRWSWKK